MLYRINIEWMLNMPKELIEFWKLCKLNEPPFSHPTDEKALWQKNRKYIETDSVNFNAFVKSLHFGENDNPRLHLSLRPVPYLGNLAQAKIYILLLNPGLAYSDYWAETNSPIFCKRLKDNLRQSFDGISFPFFKLDPQFCWCSGFMWWESKLHDVISLIAKEHYDNKYIDAMRDLSKKIACLELIPYHSSSFGSHGLIKQLDSVKMVKEFVNRFLIPQAKKNKCTLIVTRQAEAWGFPSGCKENDNIVVYRGGETRGASLSPGSRGGKAILRHYGIKNN
jgi:hypothetical protein